MNLNKSILLKIIFPAIVICYFIAMAFNNNLGQIIFKPLLVTTLLVYVATAAKNHQSPIKKIVMAALLFSIAGDALLMFANKNELFFLLGLSAFLIAHICYIICFHKIKTRENIKGRWPWAIVVAIYYYFIISFLMPQLGSMKIPVIVYGAVISFMLFTALLLYDMKDNVTARYLLAGALFFVVSDSVLAVNKFHQAVPYGGWVIMITYIAAQYLLTVGLTRYITSLKY